MSAPEPRARDAAVDALLDGHGLSEVSDAGLMRLLEALAREYGGRWQEGETVAALPPGTDITPTDVMVLVTALLKSVNLQPFELGMWQAWTGNG